MGLSFACITLVVLVNSWAFLEHFHGSIHPFFEDRTFFINFYVTHRTTEFINCFTAGALLTGKTPLMFTYITLVFLVHPLALLAHFYGNIHAFGKCITYKTLVNTKLVSCILCYTSKQWMPDFVSFISYIQSPIKAYDFTWCNEIYIKVLKNTNIRFKVFITLYSDCVA